MNISQKVCEMCEESLHIYVDYIVTGQPMPEYAAIEEHLAGCPRCASIYADLLGMVLTDEVESTADLALGVDPARDRTLLAEALKKAEIDLDLLMELSHHWLETCKSELVQDDRGAGSALSTIGILLEKKGELKEATEYHEAALEMAEQTGNDYSRARSLSSKAQIEFLQSNLREAVSYFRAALEIERELKDEFAQARSYLALGDVYAKRGKVTSGLTALTYYLRSRQVAEHIGYAIGKAAAQNRIRQHTVSLADSLQGMIGGFVEKHVNSEVSLLNRFCQDFVGQLSEALTGQRELAPQLIQARLGFGGSEVKTPVLLSVAVVAAQDVLSPKIEETLAEKEGVHPQTLLDTVKAYLEQKDTRQHLIEIGRQQGLGRAEAQRFCEYFTNLVVEKPELFIEDFSILPEG